MSPCRADTVIGITKPVGRGQCWRHRSHRRQMPSPRPCATLNIILCSPRLLRTQVAITLCLCLDKSSQSTGVDTRHTAPGPSFQHTYLQEPTSSCRPKLSLKPGVALASPAEPVAAARDGRSTDSRNNSDVEISGSRKTEALKWKYTSKSD